MDDLEVLRALVEEYSPSGQEAEAVRTLVDLAKGLGMTAEIDGAGNGIARIGGGRPTVLFLGHIDTVDGELPVRVDDERLWGRGTCDAKGALAAALLAASRHQGPGEIVVIGAVGEEQDSRGARYLLNRHRPDFLIVGEPSGWDAVTVGYKGTLSLLVRLEGERSHLSSPEPTTVERGLTIIDQFRAFCIAHQGKSPFDSLSMKVDDIQTNRSGGHDRVELGLNFRLPPGFQAGQFLDFADGLLPESYEVIDRSDAVDVDPRNAVVRALCGGIRAQETRPTLVRKGGTSDLNLAVPAWQCPAGAYGPGDSHLDHTDHERLEFTDFRRSIDVLRVAFARLTAPETLAIGVETPNAV